MTSTTLAALAAMALSLGFSYVPGLNDWFELLSKTQKRSVMALLIIVVAWGAFALSCGDVLPYVMCDKAGAVQLVECIIMALVANQSTYSISKPD